MKTAAEVCRDLLEYDLKGQTFPSPIGKYKSILRDAQKVVDAAIESGELERLLVAGEQLDTGLTFLGHKILLEISDRWLPKEGRGGHYRENVIRNKFIGMMHFKCHHEFLR
jgi:hypothetical protein